MEAPLNRFPVPGLRVVGLLKAAGYLLVGVAAIVLLVAILLASRSGVEAVAVTFAFALQPLLAAIGVFALVAIIENLQRINENLER
jgi:hypothetical protein